MMSGHISSDRPHPLVSKGFLRLLAGLGGCLLAGAVLGWPGDAEAQVNLLSMRQKLVPGNVQQCRDLLQRKPKLDPYAPASAGARETYCSCVGQAYANNMPDNVVLAFAQGKLPKDPTEQSARMRAAAVSLDAARAKCSGR